MPRSLRPVVALVAATVALVGACTGGDAADDQPSIEDFIATETPTPIIFDPNEPPPQLAGVTTQRSEIDAGQCFNEYLFTDQADFVQQVTTIVRCNGPHDSEAFFQTEYPAGESAAYPLADELERWAKGTCLEEFEDFIGREYVLSALEIGVIVPQFEAWTSAGDRNVICYVFPDQGGRLLRSMRNSGI